MTEYQINMILKDMAENHKTKDYTKRVKEGRGVTCYCAVTSQVHNTNYPRYKITWKTSQEDGYIQAAYHFTAPNLGTSFMRIAKIYPDDDNAMMKIIKALVSGLKRGKQLYDGSIEGPYDESYDGPECVCCNE